VPEKKTAAPAPPERFPMSLAEYQFASGIGPVVAEGLRVYVLIHDTPGDRYREEWDACLAAFLARPVTC
jgi:hypothetical protein